MIDLGEVFQKLSNEESYSRIATIATVAWYLGYDDKRQFSLLAITKATPQVSLTNNLIDSTKTIEVHVGLRGDGACAITFSLNDSSKRDIFEHFCNDMVSYSDQVKGAENVADNICARYMKWIDMFSKTGGKGLSYEEIKGLVGELYFLKMKMIPQYGEEKALNSWTGMEGTDQDFTCDNTWYEVKTTVTGAPSVKISSVEQLDVLVEGHLAVVILDKTSDADSSRLTLNGIVDIVCNSFKSRMLQGIFMDRLFSFGYTYDQKYDRYGFKYGGMAIYKVDSQFPCLRKETIPAAAQNVKYELSLAAIDSFKET